MKRFMLLFTVIGLGLFLPAKAIDPNNIPTTFDLGSVRTGTVVVLPRILPEGIDPEYEYLEDASPYGGIGACYVRPVHFMVYALSGNYRLLYCVKYPNLEEVRMIITITIIKGSGGGLIDGEELEPFL